MATLLSGSSAFAYTAVGAPGKIGDIPKVKQQAAWNTLGCLNALNHPASDSDTINGINDITSFNWPSSGWTSSGNNGDLRLGIATSGGVYADKSQNTGCTKEATPYAFTALGKNISASSSTADKMNLLCEIGYTQTKMSSSSSTAPRSNCASTTTRGNDDQFAHSAGATQWTLPARPLTREAELYVTFATMISDSSNSGDCWKPATSDGTTVAGYTQTNIITIGTNADRLLVKPILWKDGSSCWGSEYVTTNSATTLSSYAQAFSNETGIKIGVDDGDGSATDPTDPDSSNTDVGTAQDPCYAAQTHGFGWIVCPGLTWMTAAIDGLVGWITGGLQWTMLTDTTGNSGTTIRDVWASMLGIANIAFAIVFMIIIYSTATSSGISNYGIKKILPRLVVAAVGVNLSFYICAAAADLSNIAGVGLNDLIMSRMSGGNSPAGMFGTLFDGVLQAAVTLLIVIFAWATVFIGLLTIFVAIALRAVALTMLVIVSPLAIVASLLPNTEKWFKKWRDTFIQLLVVYPAFMVVWAGCRLVANVATETGADWSWLMASLATLAPLAVIIPLFKSTSGLMGKMTGLTEKGIGMAGGNQLKNLNKKSNAYLRDRSARVAKNVVAGGIATANQEANERGKELAELEKKKAQSWTQADAARLKNFNDRVIAGGTLTGDELKEHAALAKKQVENAAGTVPTWGSGDEETLGKARTAKAMADRKYSRRANGLLRKGVFLASDMRFTKANRDAETKRTEQGELARRLSEDQAYRARYSGVTRGMPESESADRMNRALAQASAIGNKAGDEERSNFNSLLGDSNSIGEHAEDKATGNYEDRVFENPENFSNAQATKLATDHDYSVTIDNKGVKRTLNWKTMNDNERLVVFQKAAKFGSSPEVASIRNAQATGKLFDDPALSDVAASMVVQSGNKDFLVQGANVATLAAGKPISTVDQIINVSKAPIPGSVMGQFDKAAAWADTVGSINEVRDRMMSGDTNATNSLVNLENAIRANLAQPNASRYIAAVGAEYRDILRAAQMDDADIQALFNSTGADSKVVGDAMTRDAIKPNDIKLKSS